MGIKHWYNIELTREGAEILKRYLASHSIDYEPSECDGLIHIECLIDEYEAENIEDYLSTNWALFTS